MFPLCIIIILMCIIILSEHFLESKDG